MVKMYLCVPYPYLDPYIMKNGLGCYFNYPAPYTKTMSVNGIPLTFQDNHWTMQKYIESINAARLQLTDIVRCKTEGSRTYKPPSHIIFKAIKK